MRFFKGIIQYAKRGGTGREKLSNFGHALIYPRSLSSNYPNALEKHVRPYENSSLFLVMEEVLVNF